MQVLRLPFPFDKLRVRVAQDDNGEGGTRIFAPALRDGVDGGIASPGFRCASPWAIFMLSLRESLRRWDGRGIPGPKIETLRRAQGRLSTPSTKTYPFPQRAKVARRGPRLWGTWRDSIAVPDHRGC